MAFAFDHTHSAHWLPVHIHDLENLPQSVVKEFQDHGHWVVTKTTNRTIDLCVSKDDDRRCVYS